MQLVKIGLATQFIENKALPGPARRKRETAPGTHISS
jgi:hypothetical protein